MTYGHGYLEIKGDYQITYESVGYTIVSLISCLSDYLRETTTRLLYAYVCSTFCSL